MFGFGWCHLRGDRSVIANATLDNISAVEEQLDQADKELWDAFRVYMQTNADPFMSWELVKELNNHRGLLTFCLSRNHRTSKVWEMLEWITKNGTGSYGLFYCHDDEDSMDLEHPTRIVPMDFDNVFRVHRILNGSLTELPDPFFGLIEGGIDPIHPYNRVISEM